MSDVDFGSIVIIGFVVTVSCLPHHHPQKNTNV